MKPWSREPVTLTLTIRLTPPHEEGGRWLVSGAVVEHTDDAWPEDHAEFGQSIRQARMREGISQTEFAQHVGIDSATLRNIEQNRTRLKSIHRKWIVAALAKLGIPAPGSTESPPITAPDDRER